MPKLKQIFGSSKKNKKTTPADDGKLEADALPVDDNANEDQITELASPNNSIDILPTNSVIYGESDENLLPLATTSSSSSLQLANGGTMSNSGPMMMPQIGGAVQQQLYMQISNVDSLHIGSVYHFKGNAEVPPRRNSTNNNNNASTEKPQLKPKTKSIVLMMQSKEELKHPMIDAISRHLGKGWKDVMRELGFSKGEIEQAILDHHSVGGTKEVIYSLVEAFVQRAEEDQITVGYITNLLWSLNFRDCVYQMKVRWKTAQQQNNEKN